ncbi:hypothetical protein N7488_002816 [Penicillium malachiteum]|nr:hypothetical protein N7488_002816 [Penicillium malachiteum]
MSTTIQLTTCNSSLPPSTTFQPQDKLLDLLPLPLSTHTKDKSNVKLLKASPNLRIPRLANIINILHHPPKPPTPPPLESRTRESKRQTPIPPIQTSHLPRTSPNPPKAMRQHIHQNLDKPPNKSPSPPRKSREKGKNSPRFVARSALSMPRRTRSEEISSSVLVSRRAKGHGSRSVSFMESDQ